MRLLSAVVCLIVCAGVAGAQESPSFAYPLAVATVDDGPYIVVDADVPGIFRLNAGQAPTLWVQGPKQFRQPMNRPRCVAVAKDGAVLVGDSPSRDVYRIDDDGTLNPLTEGNVGIPMSLAITDEGTVYVADLETMAVLQFPLAGGKPEVFARINTRGLFWDGSKLWGVTQTDQQLVTFDAEGKVTPIVEGRDFQFPHNVVVTDDGVAYVTDGYKKAIWQVQPDGSKAIWHEGAPLEGPVGISLEADAIVVADPRAKSVYRFDLETKEATDLAAE